MRRNTWRSIRAVLLVVCKVFLGLRYSGLDRVPKEGALLIVSNHLHNADPVVLSIVAPRQVHFMAKEELFRVPVLPKILRWGGVFPVRRGKSDRTAIRRAVETLRQDIAVGMFPEGTRSRSWVLEQGLTGSGLIATMSGARIQPVAIWGSESLPLNDSKGHRTRPWYRRPRIEVKFGETFQLPTAEELGTRVTAEIATDLMMRRIAELLPEEYRGAYA